MTCDTEKMSIPREKRQPESQPRKEEGPGRERQPQQEREAGRGLEEATPHR